MTPMLKYYVGDENTSAKPLKIFHPEVIDFLSELSNNLLQNKIALSYSDIATFAFWIRKANLIKEKSDYENVIRMGRGTAFHIAPSNIPINFAFSLVFGLLSGNGNIVRVSSKDFLQTGIVCGAINEIIDKYPKVKQNIVIVGYNHEKKYTDYFSSISDIRVIWGGNNTIAKIRESAVSPKSFDIAFADRYSFGIIDAESIKKADEEEMKKLSESFYNDTYLIDQNACSSPQLILWKGEGDLSEIKDKFWKAIYEVSKKAEWQDIMAMDKLTLATIYASKYNLKKIRSYSNRVMIMKLDGLDKNTTDIRGKFGLFAEYEFTDYDELVPILKKETQTICYYGINPTEFRDFIVDNGILGVDRIVKFGEALNLGINWDGYDLIIQMSRGIEV